MPVIRSLAARIFRKLPERGTDPDQAIALGAAIQAGLIARHQGLSDMVMTDVAPFSLGVATASEINGRLVYDRFSPLIERNTILPASRFEYFSTLGENQTHIQLQIYQGESPIASENVKLGVLDVRVPRAPKGKETIRVRFTYDTSGLLAVDVEVLSTGLRFSDLIENLAEAMPADEKARRLKAMEALKISPRDEAGNVALMETLKHLYEVLLGHDRIQLQGMITEFEAAMDAQDPALIKQTRDHLIQIARVIEENYVR
jgi:molecular chaperone HscC